METIAIGQSNIKDYTSFVYKNDLKFHQFYNIDLSVDEYRYLQFRNNFKESPNFLKRILSKSYYDIEVFYDPEIFPDPDKANYMINSVAVYNNFKNEGIIFTVPFYKEIGTKTLKKCNIVDEKTLNEGVVNTYNDLCKSNAIYNIPKIKLSVKVFKKEEDLIRALFKYILKIDTMFLIGFNSSLFDDPYTINRGKKLLKTDFNNIISEFGELNKYGDRSYEIPDYIFVDLLQMYKPVDQGGGGLGKSLPNYKLNTIAEFVLGITKLDVDNLNDTYKHDIIKFLTYNLLDTLLTFKIDHKLRFLELYWALCKYNDAPMSATVNGRSIMYKYGNNYIYNKRGKITRNRMFNREVMYPLKIEEDFENDNNY